MTLWFLQANGWDGISLFLVGVRRAGHISGRVDGQMMSHIVRSHYGLISCMILKSSTNAITSLAYAAKANRLFSMMFSHLFVLCINCGAWPLYAAV